MKTKHGGTMRRLFVLLITLGLTTGFAGNSYNVSTGSALKTALSGGSPGLAPGDTLNLRGGTFSNPTSGTWLANGAFPVTVSGTSGAPIVIRAYPGEHPIIDGLDTRNSDIVKIQSSYVWYIGLEITSSDTHRLDPTASDNEGSYASGDYVKPGTCINVDQSLNLTGNKIIDCYLHDGSGGFASTGITDDTELYNCII